MVGIAILTNAIFKGRRAAHLENDFLRVTVLEEGGHIAEGLDKRAAVSPLWIPHWTSLEPSDFSPDQHSNFGTGADAKLLAGIMGHNLCLDLFGGPSPEEAVAGFTVHGEASVDRCDITDASVGSTQVRAVRSTARAVRQDSRSRGESRRDGPSPRLDAARHAEPALSRSRDNT